MVPSWRYEEKNIYKNEYKYRAENKMILLGGQLWGELLFTLRYKISHYSGLWRPYPANMYLLKVNNRHTRRSVKYVQR